MRRGLLANGTSEVTLTFTDQHYSGTSQRENYPAICTGNYSVRGNKAEFSDMCNWIQNVHPTLILDGEYEIIINGDSVVLNQAYGDIGFYMNEYKLVKQ